MNPKLKSIGAAAAAFLATVAGLDVTGIVSVLPAAWAHWLVIVPSAAAVIVHSWQALDKLVNPGTAVKVLLVGCALALPVGLTACATSTDAKGNQVSQTDPAVLDAFKDIFHDWLHKDDPKPVTVPNLPPLLNEPPRVIPAK